MASTELMEQARTVRESVRRAAPRIASTDLARKVTWWKQTLPEAGIIEITDRGDTSAWMLSDAAMQAMVAEHEALERELEELRVRALFAARKDYTNLQTGEDLIAAVANKTSDHGSALWEAIHAGE